MRSVRWVTLILIVLCPVIIVLGISIGSVNVPVQEIWQVFLLKCFGVEPSVPLAEARIGIIWALRTPQVLLAFIVGAALSVSGTVMQSVLNNPLASSYTIGASSGASLGAALIIFSGMTFPFMRYTLVPLAALIGALVVTYLVIAFANAVDQQLTNNTIILAGMILSLFISGVQTFMSYLHPDGLQQMLMWQTGSFAMKGWGALGLLVPVTLVGTFFLCARSKEMDIMTFGSVQAQSLGVDVRRQRRNLMWVASLLTGCAVAFTGAIGFVDLIAPHVIRRFVGPRHRLVIPLAALFGGCFMVAADLLARVIIQNLALPVGVVTALVGAPFFAYVYFIQGKGKGKSKGSIKRQRGKGQAHG
jgi:iron complex transport system permease protein